MISRAIWRLSCSAMTLLHDVRSVVRSTFGSVGVPPFAGSRPWDGSAPGVTASTVPRAVTRHENAAGYVPAASGRCRSASVLRDEDDLDAAVLGAPLEHRIVRHRLELAVGGRGKAGRVDALLL